MKPIRLWLNCWVVAFYLWFHSRMKDGIGVKRSAGLKGLVPHFFYLKERKKKELIIIDYIPRKRKNVLIESGDNLLFFNGLFRTRVYKLVGISTADSFIDSYRGAIRQSRSSENKNWPR